MNSILDPTGYEGIGWLVVGLASVCVALNQIDDFFERRKPRAGFPPAEQLENSQEALAERIGKLESAAGDLRRELKEDREAVNRSAAALHRRIDAARAELSESQRRLPNEIVALLKNTNAI